MNQKKTSPVIRSVNGSQDSQQYPGDREPESVCVESGPCLFGEHEVTAVIELNDVHGAKNLDGDSCVSVK